MSLVNVQGFGESKPIEDIKIDDTKVFKVHDFDKTILDKKSGLVKFEAINRKFNLGKLLKGYGLNIDQQTMYCPFHDDHLTGKPSAKYHSDTDKLYCFSESKMYTAYHALKILYNQDMEKIFSQVWTSMSTAERQEILDKYSEDGEVSKESQSVWDKYKPLLENFKNQRIDYRQFKNGLYKVFMMMYEEGVVDEEQPQELQINNNKNESEDEDGES